jgi:signal transduction histidine kinase
MLLNGSARSLCRADPQTIETELLRLAEIARQALITARAIAHGLSPINLENGGLEPALRRLIETTQTTSGAVIKLRTRGVEMSSHVDDRMGEPLFRIVQEALTNALRHGAASEIDVVLQRVRNALHLTIADNGTGVASGDPSGGLGIRIMRYRAHAIGGHLEIESRPGGGTLVRCVIPVRPPSR